MELNAKRRMALITVIVCILAFFPVLNAGFVNYDDPEYVLDNVYIRDFSLANIKHIFLFKTTDLYVPLTVFSYLIEYSVFGANPKVFHFFNLVLHIINALLLITIFTKLNVKDRLLVCFVLVFFSVNPLVTESVCWITERKDVLYCLFYLLSVIQFLNYQHRRKTKYLLFCFLFFVLSCLSKPMAVSLPLLFLLYVFYTGNGEPVRMRLQKTVFLIPFFLVSLIFSILSIQSLALSGSTGTDYTLVEKTALLFSEIGYYFSKPFFPFKQNLFHLFPAKEKLFSNGLVVYMLIGFAVCAIVLYLFSAKKNKQVVYPFLAWLIFLLPVLQIYSNTHSYVSERYFYLSIVFPVIIVFSLLQRISITPPVYRFALIALTCIFTFLSINRSNAWKNSQTLFEAELKADPNNPLALNNLGYYYNNAGNFALAIPILKKAVAIDRANSKFLNNYGWALAASGHTDTAIVYLQRAIDLKPTYTEALNNAGICYMQKHDPERAAVYFKKAYVVSPGNSDVLCNLGLYYYNSGKKEKGLPLLQKAWELGNTKARKYLNR